MVPEFETPPLIKRALVLKSGKTCCRDTASSLLTGPASVAPFPRPQPPPDCESAVSGTPSTAILAIYPDDANRNLAENELLGRGQLLICFDRGDVIQVPW